MNSRRHFLRLLASGAAGLALAPKTSFFDMHIPVVVDGGPLARFRILHEQYKAGRIGISGYDWCLDQNVAVRKIGQGVDDLIPIIYQDKEGFHRFGMHRPETWRVDIEAGISGFMTCKEMPRAEFERRYPRIRMRVC